MDSPFAEPKPPRPRSFWRKKVALLGYLEAFHLAENAEALFQSLRRLLRAELYAREVLFSMVDVRKGSLFYAMPPELKGRAVRPGEGFAGRALQQNRALLFSPAEAQAISSGLSELILPHRPQYSVLAAPLLRDGRILGTVELIDPEGGYPFTPADFEYFEALVPHMAVALNHFVLGEESRRQHQKESHLKEVIRTLNSSFNLRNILDGILLRVGELIPFDCAAVVLFPLPSRERTMAIYGYTGEELPALEERAAGIQRYWLEREAASLLLSDRDFEGGFARVRSNIRSEILVPLVSGDRLLGVFSLASEQADAYSAADAELVEAFGSQTSLAVDRAILHESAVEKAQLEQELRIARDIQLRFLPGRMPEIAGLQTAARNVASRLVSGDYYDFIPIVAGQWGLVVGDVSGKGISAGLIMSAFRASLLAEIRNNFSISRILAKVNRLLWETTAENRFVTAFYGVFDERHRILTYSNAGHNPPLLLRRDSGLEWLMTGGTLLGSFPDSAYHEERVVLAEGDLLLLYTDGLTESHLPDGEELGRTGLEELVLRHRDRSVDEIADQLVEQVTRSSVTETPEDDATMVVIRLGPAG